MLMYSPVLVYVYKLLKFSQMNVKQHKWTACAEEEFVDRAAEMEMCTMLINDNSVTQHASDFIYVPKWNPNEQHMQ